jgi:hypothetical protein
MSRSKLIRSVLAVLIPSMCLWMQPALAGDEEAAGEEGGYVENAVAGRNLVLRLRGEVQFSESDMSLIENDVNYATYPSKVYNTEAKAIQDDGSSARVAYSRWQSSQGLDMSLWQWKLRFPLQSSDFRDVTESPPFLSFSYWAQQGNNATNATLPEVNYWYIGIDKTTRKSVFMLFQYRSTVQDGSVTGHELYEYLSWKISDRLHIGEQGAVDKNQGTSGISPWYGSVFGTVFLVPEKTALRLDGWYFNSDTMNYEQADAYLTQRIGKRAFVRLNYRFYHDSNKLESNAAGIKFKYYFSPRMSAHVGYRMYDHTENVNLNTFFGGFSIIL